MFLQNYAEGLAWGLGVSTAVMVMFFIFGGIVTIGERILSLLGLGKKPQPNPVSQSIDGLGELVATYMELQQAVGDTPNDTSTEEDW